MKNNWLIMTLEDVKFSLNDIINKESELNKILVDQKGASKCYAIDKEKLNKLATVSSISTCYDEDVAKKLIVKAFDDNLEEIAKWLMKPGTVLKLKVNNLEPVGYQINNRKETPCYNAIVTLRRDIDYLTEYGFYISGVVPTIS